MKHWLFLIIQMKKKKMLLSFNKDGFDIKCVPHHKHIKLLKEFKSRGHSVVVWSDGGYDWAQLLVKELNLIKYVDLIMCKPKWYLDDLTCKDFLGKHFYFPLTEKKPI